MLQADEGKEQERPQEDEGRTPRTLRRRTWTTSEQHDILQRFLMPPEPAASLPTALSPSPASSNRSTSKASWRRRQAMRAGGTSTGEKP